MIIGRGAEAIVELSNGKVIKKRIEKKYRHPEIDRKLRKERNRKEARLMEAAKNVPAPRVFSVGEFHIEMEFIDGKRLKEFKDLGGMEEEIGKLIGRLHSRGIAHNDLTTSNIIKKGNELFLIDFGLAERGKIEDFATDLKVFFEAAKATHEFSREEFLKGYSKEMPEHKKVIKRLEAVYKRGRYIIR